MSILSIHFFSNIFLHSLLEKIEAWKLGINEKFFQKRRIPSKIEKLRIG